MKRIRRLANALTGALVPLTLLATTVGVLAPAREVAARSDVILAALVMLTALGIDPRELAALRRKWGALLALSLGPFVVADATSRSPPLWPPRPSVRPRAPSAESTACSSSWPAP